MKTLEVLKILFIVILLNYIPKKIKSIENNNKLESKITAASASDSFKSNLLNIYDNNPIKDGVFTTITENGPLKGFSFQEKEDMKKFSAIENYFPKKVKDGN